MTVFFCDSVSIFVIFFFVKGITKDSDVNQVKKWMHGLIDSKNFSVGSTFNGLAIQLFDF